MQVQVQVHCKCKRKCMCKRKFGAVAEQTQSLVLGPRGFWKVIPDPEDVVLAPFALENLDMFYAPFVSGSHSHRMRQSWRQLEVKMNSDLVEDVALLARCLVRRLVQVPASVYGGI